MEFKARQLAHGSYREWTGKTVTIEAKTVIGAKRKAAQIFGNCISFSLFCGKVYVAYRNAGYDRTRPEWISFCSSEEDVLWKDDPDYEKFLNVDAVEERRKARDARIAERNALRADRINRLQALIDQAQAIAEAMEDDYSSFDICKSYSNEILADLNNVYGRIEKLRFA